MTNSQQNNSGSLGGPANSPTSPQPSVSPSQQNPVTTDTSNNNAPTSPQTSRSGYRNPVADFREKYSQRQQMDNSQPLQQNGGEPTDAAQPTQSQDDLPGYGHLKVIEQWKKQQQEQQQFPNQQGYEQAHPTFPQHYQQQMMIQQQQGQGYGQDEGIPLPPQPGDQDFDAYQQWRQSNPRDAALYDQQLAQQAVQQAMQQQFQEIQMQQFEQQQRQLVNDHIQQNYPAFAKTPEIQPYIERMMDEIADELPPNNPNTGQPWRAVDIADAAIAKIKGIYDALGQNFQQMSQNSQPSVDPNNFVAHGGNLAAQPPGYEPSIEQQIEEAYSRGDHAAAAALRYKALGMGYQR